MARIRARTGSFGSYCTARRQRVKPWHAATPSWRARDGNPGTFRAPPSRWRARSCSCGAIRNPVEVRGNLGSCTVPLFVQDGQLRHQLFLGPCKLGDLLRAGGLDPLQVASKLAQQGLRVVSFNHDVQQHVFLVSLLTCPEAALLLGGFELSGVRHRASVEPGLDSLEILL